MSTNTLTAKAAAAKLGCGTRLIYMLCEERDKRPAYFADVIAEQPPGLRLKNTRELQRLFDKYTRERDPRGRPRKASKTAASSASLTEKSSDKG